MKPDESDPVAPPSLTPPPCFLDGSLTSLLSQDITRLPDISHLQDHQQGKEDDTYSESAISPPSTPLSSKAEPSSLPLHVKPSLTYTDLSLSSLPSMPPRPPFPLEFLLGSSQHQNQHQHHAQHQHQTQHQPQHQSQLHNQQQIRHHQHQSQHLLSSNLPSTRPDTSSRADDKTPAPTKRNRPSKSKTQTAKTESPTSPGANSTRGKRNRINFTANQLRKLEKVFLTTPYPEPHLYESLADELSLQTKNLKTWFQNKRARNKKQKLQETGGNLNRKPEVLPYMAPYQTSMSSAIPQYAYNMVGGLMPPPTHPSTLITPPPSPQMMKHPMNIFPPPNMSVRSSSVSPPPITTFITSPDSRTSKYHPVPRAISPVLPAPDIRLPCHYPQPGQSTPRFVHHSFPYPGFYHDRLSHAEYRDVHEPAPQETPQAYPSMLSALEKLCSSLPL